jgi:putative transposase
MNREEPRRRKKVRHFDEPGHAHFLTFSCYRRLPLLSENCTRLWLLNALEAARTKHAFDLWAWVIVPEHVHLLLWPRRAVYHTRLILADSGTHRRFWQAGPGQDRNVYDPATAYTVIEYIHNNAVERGLVARPEDWAWSSARDWAGSNDVLLKVDRTIPGTTEFGTK